MILCLLAGEERVIVLVKRNDGSSKRTIEELGTNGGYSEKGNRLIAKYHHDKEIHRNR